MLAALQRPESREVENALVGLLDFENFELIKELMRNRARIVWCMRLGRAQVCSRSSFCYLRCFTSVICSCRACA